MDLGVDDVAAQPIGVGLNNLQSAGITDMLLRALAGKIGIAEWPILTLRAPTILGLHRYLSKQRWVLLGALYPLGIYKQVMQRIFLQGDVANAPPHFWCGAKFTLFPA